MSGTCEVIGWLFDGGEARRVVRQKDGETSLENIHPEGTLGGMAIQTGTFRRGKPIIDSATQQCVGYEMEPVQTVRCWS